MSKPRLTEALKAFRRSMEAQGDGGEEIGEVDKSYHVRGDDVTAIANPYEHTGEAETASGSYHEVLRAAGYRRVKTGRDGSKHYAMEADGKIHRVVVRADEAQARYTHPTAGTSVHESAESLAAAIARKGKTFKGAEAVSRFWAEYVREV